MNRPPEARAASGSARRALAALTTRAVRIRLRIIAGVLGGAVYGYWWATPTQGMSPKVSFVLWLISLLLLASALFKPWPVPRPTRSVGIAFIVLALAIIARSASLSQIPYGIKYDEVMDAWIGLDVLRHHPWEIFSGGARWHFQHPYLVGVLQAWPCLVFDPLFGSRLASVILSVGSLLGTYALGTRLIGRGPAIISLAVLSSSYWHVAYSRMGYTYMQPMFAVPWGLFVVWLGNRHRNRFLQFCGGILVGASVLLYEPSRIVLPIVIIWLIHRAIVGDTRLREAALGLVVIGLGAALLVSPYLRSEGTQGILHRYLETTGSESSPLRLASKSGWVSDRGREIFVRQARAATHAYFSRGAMFGWDHGVDTPLVDPVSLSLAMVGFCVAIAKVRDSDLFLLVVWVSATFVMGQVLTDVPTSAYRAAPLLPALAICAGLGASVIGAAARRWLRLPGICINAVALAVFAAFVAPENLSYLRNYSLLRRLDWDAGMARLISAGNTDSIYYLVAPEPQAGNVILQFIGGGRTLRDMPSLADGLGRTIDETHDAVFIFHPSVAVAADVVRRCYPGATLLAETGALGDPPVLGLSAPRSVIAAGRNCEVPSQGPGLLARYFTNRSWDGDVTRERIEDWPYSHKQTEEDFGSVEWSGFIHAPVGGQYQFHLWTREGAVAEATIGSAGSSVQVTALRDVSTALDQGDHRVSIRCLPAQPHAGWCWLHWAPPGGGLVPIPPQFLRPPSEIPEAFQPISLVPSP